MNSLRKKAEDLAKYWKNLDKKYVFLTQQSKDEKFYESNDEREVRVILRLYKD